MSKIFKTKNLIIPLLFALVIGYLSFVITPSSALASTIKSPPSNLGLVGYWTLNEGTGTAASDTSGNSNTGTLNGGAAFNSTGHIGGSATISGASKYISVPTSASIAAVGTTMTVSFWVYLNSVADSTGMFSHGSGGNAGWMINTASNCGGVASRLAFWSANGNYVCSDYNMPTGQWVNVSVVRNGSNTIFYVNGVNHGTVAASVTTGSGIGLAFGRVWTDVDNYYMNGKIDEIRFYNTALSTTDIAALYHYGQAKLGVSQSTNSLTTGLVEHLSFDGSKTAWTDATTGTATDSSGNSNTGTFTNMSRATAPVRGQIGQGILLDGTDDFISVTTNAGLQDHSNGLSVSFWVKFTSITDEVIISKYDQNSPNINGYVFFLNNSHWYWQLRDGNTCCRGAEAATGPTAGVWYHVILWWDKTNGKAYVNGTEVLTFAASGALTSTGDNLEIGRSNDGANANIAATFDDVRVYSRALTAAERTRLYNLGRPSVVKFTGLLDRVPNATAAYSVRKLRAGYTGSAIRVRRSSDNAEQDIGFASDWLNTVALESFVGAGNDGFVVTWYNQASSGTDATQSTTTLQPQIVSAGSTITQNGKPAVYFPGTSRISATSVTIGGSTIFTVARSSANGGQLIWEHGANAGSFNGQWLYTHNDAAAIRWFRLGIAGSGKIFSSNWGNNASMRLLTVDYDGTQAGMKLFINTAEQSLTNTGSGNPGTGDASTTFNIGARANNDFKLTGYIQEIVVYGSQLSTGNRNTAELNINRAYTLY